MPYQEELAYLYSLRQFGIKLGLSNIRHLSAILGNPQDHIKTIHVAGTNGKGSTAAVLASILKEAGYSVGLYTSPHLSDFTERIQINNMHISREDVLYLIKNIREQIKGSGLQPTFFEFATALAFMYFANKGIDIAIIEVGMGGRLDATNIINPLVSIITNVEYDHTEHLGPTLEGIAMEKCGIIKSCAPVVTSETKTNILSIIEKGAKKSGTLSYAYGKDFNAVPVRITEDISEFYYNGYRLRGLLLQSRLRGRHQLFNMGSAIYTIELLTGKGFDVNEGHIISGIENTSWPGRLEFFPGCPGVILDGAHNHAGIIALREFIEGVLLKKEIVGKIIFIFGVLKDKDASSMAGEIIPYASEIIITKPDSERGLDVEILMEIFEGYGVKALSADTISEALNLAYRIASPDDIIIFTGSLYVVGEARELILTRGHAPIRERG